MQDSTNTKGTLRLPQVVALYIGAVLGSGILILPGVAADLAGPASLVAWGLMAVLAVPMALTMALLSARFPDSGGVSFFVTQAFNSRIGSLVGWFFLMSSVIAAPVIAFTGAGYVCEAAGLGNTAYILISVAILASGILLNYLGIKNTGQVQIAVVLTIIVIIIVTIAGSLTRVEPVNFTPFMPNGWESVGHASAILFWCFLGWEAVSHISGEFENPRRDAIVGTLIACAVVSILYFLTALVVVGTHSYGTGISDVSLVHIIRSSFGPAGAAVAGIAALFICMAPAIVYCGAASRLACSLANSGFAPRVFALQSQKYSSPLGGLLFLSCCFVILLAVFCTGLVSLSTLIQVPSGTFILTYVGGCAAGIVLLKGCRWGREISAASLILTCVILVFTGWMILFPLAITLAWYIFLVITGRHHGILNFHKT
jgi:amino acid efflux transporter